MPGRGRGRKKSDADALSVGLSGMSVASSIGQERQQPEASQPKWQQEEGQFEDVEQSSSNIAASSTTGGSTGDSPQETFKFSSEKESYKKKVIQTAEGMSAPLRVQRPDESTRVGGKNEKKETRRKIILRANHFKVNITLSKLWQYRIDWGEPDTGSAPALKGKEERRGAFVSLVDQHIKRSIDASLNVSGGDKTILPQSGAGPVYDGENIVYYYKDLSNMPFWRESSKMGNWNTSVKDTMEKSGHYQRTKDSPKAQDMWNEEKARKNTAMFPDRSKNREFIKIYVNHVCPGYRLATRYPVHLTKVKEFSADDFQAAANGTSADTAVLQAIDIIMRFSVATNKKFLSIGNTIYPKPSGDELDRNYMGKGKDVWFGYHQSVRPCAWKQFTLNIDQHVTPFYRKCNMVDFCAEYFGANRNQVEAGLQNKGHRDEFEKAIKGLTFASAYETEHGDHMRYKINGLDEDAMTARFVIDVKNDVQITVADYFKNNLGQTLHQPKLPCIRVGSTKSKRKRLFPMEKCLMLDQKVKKLAEDDVSNIIRKAVAPAPQMRDRLEKMANTAVSAVEEVCQDYGVEIADSSRPLKMTKIMNGEVISPPKLEFDGATVEATAKGSSGNYQLNRKFYQSKSISNWKIVAVGRGRAGNKEINTFQKMLQQEGRKLGMNIAEANRIDQKDLASIEDYIQACAEDNTELLVIVLPRKSSHDYSWVKKLAELQYGVMTQCILDKTFCGKPNRGFDSMTAVNLLLKINTKMDGINCRIAKESRIKLFDGPVMVLAASLSHSMGPGPTVAAVTASIDSAGAQYIAFSALQKKTHFIEGIKEMTKKALKGFYKATADKGSGCKPLSIIYYRDGLGEGQYDDALKYEVSEIRTACLEVEEGYRPGITMMSVQRRHHTKLFCEEKRDMDGRAENIPAGTVVDHGVTHARLYDFYLCAHAGIMGTSRPAHFMLLHDDNNLSGHSLQVMSFYLSHTYARCTRTVGMPVAVYYAQLMAQRARYWLRHSGYVDDDSASTMSNDSNEAHEKLLNASKALEGLHKDLRHRMFFC